jgi:3-methyl-2-oxobutanoate hydroxymethyltransferase
MPALTKKFTFGDLRAARASGAKIPMLTCYDFTTASLMQEAGVPMLLVGDSAANVVLGYDSTLPIKLEFLITLTAAVRRGAPLAFVCADMPFGSCAQSTAQAIKNVVRMVQLSACDAVKIETSPAQKHLVARLADAGVAVIAHLGLRPQSVGVLGGYRFQGRTAADAARIIDEAVQLERSGAAGFLLEAVPPDVSAAVVAATSTPVFGCGAGPACHAHVVVTHDAVKLTDRRPRFVPLLGDLATPAMHSFEEYVRQVSTGKYPAPEHHYEMPPEEKIRLAENLARSKTRS